MKKHLPTIIVVVIFLCGLSLFLYPTVSDLYNQYLNNKLIGDYKDAFKGTSEEELDKAMDDAVAFNENRTNPVKWSNAVRSSSPSRPSSTSICLASSSWASFCSIRLKV